MMARLAAEPVPDGTSQKFASTIRARVIGDLGKMLCCQGRFRFFLDILKDTWQVPRLLTLPRLHNSCYAGNC